MPNIDMMKLRAELKQDEGCVLHAYQDSLGYWTIGTGVLIDERKGGGISQYEADFLLDNRLQKLLGNLDSAMPWILGMSDARQRALCNMSFQLGVNGLKNFKKMLQCMRIGNFDEAAKECLNSNYAKQTPERAQRVAKLIREG